MFNSAYEKDDDEEEDYDQSKEEFRAIETSEPNDDKSVQMKSFKSDIESVK